jgi:aldehyde dehydrogenase (NAD+)
VEEPVYEEFTSRFVERAGSLIVGDTADESTEMGPLITPAQRDSVEGYIQVGVNEGAKLVCGGERVGTVGNFLSPAVFTGAESEMRIVQEEIFGPVVAIIPYDDEQDAVRIANDSPYGLGGSVFSADVERAKDVARQVQTGTIGVNGYPVAIGSPFGGVKESGIGREFGPEALNNYLNLKSIYVGA